MDRRRGAPVGHDWAILIILSRLLYGRCHRRPKKSDANDDWPAAAEVFSSVVFSSCVSWEIGRRDELQSYRFLGRAKFSGRISAGQIDSSTKIDRPARQHAGQHIVLADVVVPQSSKRGE